MKLTNGGTQKQKETLFRIKSATPHMKSAIAQKLILSSKIKLQKNESFHKFHLLHCLPWFVDDTKLTEKPKSKCHRKSKFRGFRWNSKIWATFHDNFQDFPRFWANFWGFLLGILWQFTKFIWDFWGFFGGFFDNFQDSGIIFWDFISFFRVFKDFKDNYLDFQGFWGIFEDFWGILWQFSEFSRILRQFLRIFWGFYDNLQDFQGFWDSLEDLLSIFRFFSDFKDNYLDFQGFLGLSIKSINGNFHNVQIFFVFSFIITARLQFYRPPFACGHQKKRRWNNKRKIPGENISI